MTPRNDFDREERKTPSKRNWQPRPERGDDQPRGPKRPKPRRPDDVVWDWENADEDIDDDGDLFPPDDDLEDDSGESIVPDDDI